MTGLFIMGKNYEFAKDGREIYTLPEDKKFFHNYIKGTIVIVGNKTFETLPASIWPLPAEWVVFARSFHESFANIHYIRGWNIHYDKYFAREYTKDGKPIEGVCIGGAMMLERMAEEHKLDKLVVTQVMQEFPDADMYVPQKVIDLMTDANLVSMDTLCFEAPMTARVLTYHID